MYSKLGHLFLEVSRKVIIDDDPEKTYIARRPPSGQVVTRRTGEVATDARHPSRSKPAQGNVRTGSGNAASRREEQLKREKGERAASKVRNNG
jgi:hypothetical protein